MKTIHISVRTVVSTVSRSVKCLIFYDKKVDSWNTTWFLRNFLPQIPWGQTPSCWNSGWFSSPFPPTERTYGYTDFVYGMQYKENGYTTVSHNGTISISGTLFIGKHLCYPRPFDTKWKSPLRRYHLHEISLIKQCSWQLVMMWKMVKEVFS